MIIALYSPQAQSGKSTLAQYFVEKHNFIEMKFMQPVRAAWFGMLKYANLSEERLLASVEALKEIELHEAGFVSYRRFAETLGGELRQVNPNVWINQFEQRLQAISISNKKIVVSDLRYPNEYHFLNTMNAKFIQIHRLKHTRHYFYKSENHLNPFDYYFHNTIVTSSFKELREIINERMPLILKEFNDVT